MGMGKPKVTPERKRRKQPSSVLRYHEDGSYDWQCLTCGHIHTFYGPHRGRRKTHCDTCVKHNAYRARNPVVQRESWNDYKRSRHGEGRLPF